MLKIHQSLQFAIENLILGTFIKICKKKATNILDSFPKILNVQLLMGYQD